MAKKKADFQADAAALGIEFEQSHTIAELKASIATVVGIASPDDERSQEEIDTAEMSAGRKARREAHAKEAALAFENRAKDQAEAAAKIRTAAQQAVDRAEAGV